MIEIICFIFLLGIMYVFFFEATTEPLPAIFDSSSSTIFRRSKGFLAAAAAVSAQLPAIK
jgi:hypothetical protein